MLILRMKSAKNFIYTVNQVVLQTWEYVWNNPDMEEPPLYVSENEDGTVNFSYPRSCLYTVNEEGIAVCREFPDEVLDLNSFETLNVVCATIFNDMTGGSKEDLVYEMTIKAINKLFEFE